MKNIVVEIIERMWGQLNADVAEWLASGELIKAEIGNVIERDSLLVAVPGVGVFRDVVDHLIIEQIEKSEESTDTAPPDKHEKHDNSREQLSLF